MKVTRRLRERLGERLGPAARDLAGQARERLADQLGDRLGDRGDRLAERIEPNRPPDAQGNRPRAAFAGVLDGRHLWLAVDATPGTLAVRPKVDRVGDQPGTGNEVGNIVPLTSDIAEDDPRYRSVRSDLAILPTQPGNEEARFEVVITAPGGKLHRVWTPPLARNQPVRPPARDGVQWRVARSTDGTLELIREPAPDGALLVDIDIDADDVTTLRISGAPEGSDLRLVDDESGQVRATRPLSHEGGLATGTVGPDDVPEGLGLSLSVHVGELPVRRRANDLTRPAGAVLLPQVQNPDTDDETPQFTLVFRWLPDGVLRVRRPKGQVTDTEPDKASGADS